MALGVMDTAYDCVVVNPDIKQYTVSPDDNSSHATVPLSVPSLARVEYHVEVIERVCVDTATVGVVSSAISSVNVNVADATAYVPSSSGLPVESVLSTLKLTDGFL